MIFADHASTTPLRREALETMWPFLTTAYGNPSAHNQPGRQARMALDAAREDMGKVLGCSPHEITFTAGGTEADNLALTGTALASPKGRHIVVSAIEHEALMETCRFLEVHHSFTVDRISVDTEGRVDIDALAAALTPETTVCSVMYANNEIGTVQPVNRIAQLCREKGVPFHVDAVQAPGWLPVDVRSVGADMMSLSAHKFGGPKGTGLLYASSDQALEPMVHGGGQERGRRSGTENVAGAVGTAVALRMADADRALTAFAVAEMRDRLINGVLDRVDGAIVTGHRQQRLANHASFCFKNLNGEALLIELEEMGVVCSSGSSCSADNDEPSPVLLAIGIDRELARSALRLSISPTTTADEIDQIIENVATAADNVRRLR